MGKYDSCANSTEQQYLLSEVYYLSGYILETGLSYAFFSHIHFTGDVNQSEHFSKGFKTHSIQMKYHYMNLKSCFINDLVFVSRKHNIIELQTLFNEWDVKYRYENYPHLSKQLISQYIDEVGKNLARIKTQYPS